MNILEKLAFDYPCRGSVLQSYGRIIEVLKCLREGLEVAAMRHESPTPEPEPPSGDSQTHPPQQPHEDTPAQTG